MAALHVLVASKARHEGLPHRASAKCRQAASVMPAIQNNLDPAVARTPRS